MSEDIAESLGVMLALFEEDLSSDPDRTDMLDKIHKISEIYRNFGNAEFCDFPVRFAKGYASGKQGIAFDNEPLDHDATIDDAPSPA